MLWLKYGRIMGEYEGWKLEISKCAHVDTYHIMRKWPCCLICQCFIMLNCSTIKSMSEIISFRWKTYVVLFSLIGHAQPRKSKWHPGEKARSVVKHAKTYSSLWAWILFTSAVTCAIAAQRAYKRVEMMRDVYDTPLVIAKVAGTLWSKTRYGTEDFSSIAS